MVTIWDILWESSVKWNLFNKVKVFVNRTLKIRKIDFKYFIKKNPASHQWVALQPLVCCMNKYVFVLTLCMFIKLIMPRRVVIWSLKETNNMTHLVWGQTDDKNIWRSIFLESILKFCYLNVTLLNHDTMLSRLINNWNFWWLKECLKSYPKHTSFTYNYVIIIIAYLFGLFL